MPDKKTVALDMLAEEYKVGKINPIVLRALFKVVIDDTYYEISGVMDYINHLEEQVKRLKTIQKYEEKMQKCKKEKDIDYYKEGMRLLFARGEDFNNYKQILSEYEQAIITRKEVMAELYEEIRIIKKLKV